MSQPRLFRKRPTTIEAWQWDGTDECAALIVDWIIDNAGPLAYKHPHEPLIIFDDETAAAQPGDWIIRDQFNDFWPIEDALFPGAYEALLPE